MKLEELFDILVQDKPSILIKNNEEKIFELIPELRICKGFNQNNEWHIFDVYEHILHVLDNVENNLILRLAALFHDVGKPLCYTEDELKVGHFYGHWEKSKEIFEEFASKYNIDESIKEIVSNLILYHDINFDKLSKDELDVIIKELKFDGIIKLFNIKRSDLLSQNPKYHYMLGKYDEQENKILSYINRGINMEKVFNKLVRDNIPEIIKNNNEVPFTRILDDEEYRRELYKKLLEECNEVINSKNSSETMEELSDVLEVMQAIISLEGKTLEDIKKIADDKRNKRGGFQKRIFLERTYSKEE